MRIVANTLFVVLVAIATFVIFSASGATGNPGQCNENNPENCPSPTAVCDKGKAKGNPHCETPTAPPTATPTATATATARPTQAPGGGSGQAADESLPVSTPTSVPQATPRATPTVLISPPPIILPPNPRLPKSGN